MTMTKLRKIPHNPWQFAASKEENFVAIKRVYVHQYLTRREIRSYLFLGVILRSLGTTTLDDKFLIHKSIIDHEHCSESNRVSFCEPLYGEFLI